MTQKICRTLCLLMALLLIASVAGKSWAQSGSQGTISVTVTDLSGGVVPGTSLQLVDLSTNDVRKATTKDNGTYSFVNLSIGHYKLIAAHKDYQHTELTNIQVHAAMTTDVPVLLQVGASSETLVVNSTTAPLVETSSNSIGTIVDLKQIDNLPLNGRDVTSLAYLTPGYTGVWNGQPEISQGSNLDGTVGQSGRMKMFGNAEPAVEPRLEDIEEMSVQTDQLDLDQGFGQATMQLNFVTRRGTNETHGRLFDNFHNSGLNANSYSNNVNKVPRAKSIYNDFGGAVGGQILKDKLFYFGSFALKYIPGGYTTGNSSYLSSSAQTGMFTYLDTTGTKQTVNVLSIANNFMSTLPNSVNSVVSQELANINKSVSAGKVTPSTSDPTFQSVSWYVNNTDKTFYPTGRLDYNATQNLRMNLVWSMTEDIQPGSNPGPYPGAGFTGRTAGNKTKNYTTSYGVDWMITPSLINQFKAGFLYNTTFDNYNASQAYKATDFQMVDWAIGDSGLGSYTLPITSYYPAFNASDSFTMQKGTHTAKFGFSWYHEQDHYWNAPTGYPTISLGMATGDPAINAFTKSASGTLPNASDSSVSKAIRLFATLAGRVTDVGGAFPYSTATKSYTQGKGTFALDEVSSAWGLFAQDSWRLTPTLTLNYGLRWDFTSPSEDKNHLYHSADTSSVFGPTAPSDLFKPGTLKGNANPTLAVQDQAFAPYHVTPQPAIGLAWNPIGSDNWLGKIVGESKTVIRVGYSLRRFTEPYQYYWNNISDQAAFYTQGFDYTANTTGTTGTFTPGSMTLGTDVATYSNTNNYSKMPTSYQTSFQQSDYTFKGCLGCTYPGVAGIDKKIDQPYMQSWNLGIQRSLGTRALEVRYAGNRTLHQWINNNTNEVNVFENGFLDEFKQAQSNLKAYRLANSKCDANGNCSFANNGLSGQSAVPTMDAAFAGETTGGSGIPLADYANSTLIGYLDTGQVGAFAQYLTTPGTTNYFCNLVGSSFAPCMTNGGYSGGVGAGKPINFFQANPYATGEETQYMTAGGYSNYHSLQVDLRQQQWQGLQFDLNYTWSHTLGFQVNTDGVTASGYGCGGYNGWCDWPGTLTLRNTRLAYGPSQFDVRHSFHFSGTYDLPIGKGKLLLSQNNLVSKVLGDWTVGMLATFQTGTPRQIIGNNLTYNDYGDGGVRLNNVTIQQLQKAVGVHRVPGKPYALLINPKYLQSADGSGGANTNYITSNTTPGTIIHPVYLFGPHAFYNDLSLSKNFPIFREFKMKIQAEATNVWNHPVFGNTSGSFGGSPNWAGGNIQNSGWGTSGVTNSPRVIEFRGNIEF